MYTLEIRSRWGNGRVIRFSAWPAVLSLIVCVRFFFHTNEN